MIPKTTVEDLTPLIGMQLEHFNCNESLVRDLAPLKGMPLTYLLIGWTRVTDLSPIQGMALESITFGGTRVEDIAPLSGMPLKTLECRDSYVCDLSPLKGMRLNKIRLYGTRVSDLSPLAGMPLRTLWCDVRLFDEDERSLIASLPLTGLNGHVDAAVPVEETLKVLEARRHASLTFAQATSKLPPSERIEAVAAKLEELNGPGAVNLGGHPQRDANADAWVMLKGSKRVDITPLMALTQLKKLDIIGGRSNQDISCLKFLELEELNCDDWVLFKNLGVLKDMDTLKRVNGHPAAEYLEYVAREGLNHFAHPKRAPIPWDVTPEQQAFFDHVAKLPADEQAAAVAKKLMEVNPGFDGKFEQTIRDGRVVVFKCFTDNISNPATDVWPVRALPALQQFICRGDRPHQGNVTNLEQLRGMRLTSVSVKDSKVKDLSPLIGMPIMHVACYRTKVADLSPLRDMPLEHLQYDVRLFDEEEEAFLRSLPLQFINGASWKGQPIAEFWQEMAERREAAKAFAVETAQLPPIKQFAAVVAKFDELHGSGTVRLAAKLQGEAVNGVEAYLASGERDVTPLMAIEGLKKLTLHDCVPWQDLSCLKFLPLEELTCSEDALYKNNRTLRAIKTLRTINGEPAANYWRDRGLMQD